METTFKYEEPPKFIYCHYSNFSSECFKDDFCLAFARKNMITQVSRKKFIATLNKIKRQSKTSINKALRKAIMKRSQLQHKANKTPNATDILNYTKQKNYKVQPNN